ncbi:hypothetical protein [Thalassotalea insulae]|nr:hypothetical protein [Thalassotalea insulae]
MTQRKQDYSTPSWGKSCAVQIKQAELIVKGIGSLLTSIQEIIFSLKKLWLGLGGPTVFYYLGEKVDWQALSAVIN